MTSRIASLKKSNFLNSAQLLEKYKSFNIPQHELLMKNSHHESILIQRVSTLVSLISTLH